MKKTEKTVEVEDTPKWYAVYTLPRAEKKLGRLFQKYRISAFLPTIIKKTKWSDRWKETESPLFSSYIFVNITFWKEKGKVLQLPGSHHFIFAKGKPAEIPQEDIDTLKIMVEQFPDRTKTEREEAFQPGKKVKIMTGAFKDRIVEIVKLQTKVMVLVRLPMMNQVVTAEFHIDDLTYEGLNE